MPSSSTHPEVETILWHVQTPPPALGALRLRCVRTSVRRREERAAPGLGGAGEEAGTVRREAVGGSRSPVVAGAHPVPTHGPAPSLKTFEWRCVVMHTLQYVNYDLQCPYRGGREDRLSVKSTQP